MFGQGKNLKQKLLRKDKSSFQNFLRLDEILFMEVLGKIAYRIQKQVTFRGEQLEPGLRYAVTLWYLAKNDSCKILSYSLRDAHNTISLIVYGLRAFTDLILECVKGALVVPL